MKFLVRRSLVGIFLATCFLWIACGGDTIVTTTTGSGGQVSNTNSTAEATFSLERDLAGRSNLRVRGVNGSVTITGGAQAGSITITGVRRVESDSVADAEANLPELQVQVTDLANEILVQTIQPADSGGRNFIVNYTITVPQQLNVSVENINGAITLGQISGSATVNLVNGQIEGQLTLTTDGSIELTTVNGAINLRIPRNTSATFSARVVNGTITVSNLSLQNQVSTNTSLEGTLGAGRGTLTLRVTNGNITVTGV